MSGIEFFLWKLSHEHAESVQLGRRDQSPEQPVEVLGVEHLTLRDIAKFGMRREENRRGKLRQQTFRQIKVHIESFESLKFLGLDLRKHLAPHSLLDVREPIEAWRERALFLNVIGGELAQLLPRHARAEFDDRTDRLRLALRHGDAFFSPTAQVITVVQQLVLAFHDIRFLGDILLHDLISTLLGILAWWRAEHIIGKIHALEALTLGILEGADLRLLFLPFRSWLGETRT